MRQVWAENEPERPSSSLSRPVDRNLAAESTAAGHANGRRWQWAAKSAEVGGREVWRLEVGPLEASDNGASGNFGAGRHLLPVAGWPSGGPIGALSVRQIGPARPGPARLGSHPPEPLSHRFITRPEMIRPDQVVAGRAGAPLTGSRRKNSVTSRGGCWPRDCQRSARAEPRPAGRSRWASEWALKILMLNDSVAVSLGSFIIVVKIKLASAGQQQHQIDGHVRRRRMDTSGGWSRRPLDSRGDVNCSSSSSPTSTGGLFTLIVLLRPARGPRRVLERSGG